MLNSNMENENYEIYELVLKDAEDEVFALSLVENPAIQQDFVWLSKTQKEEVKFAEVDGDKHLIVGPILLPDEKIIRVKEDGTPYWVTFSKDTVKEIAQKYIKDNNANNVTLEHKRPTNGVSLVESWITESTQYDKARAYNLMVKPGTWMGVFKVDSPEVWKKVKSGEFKGISLEGMFSHVLLQASEIEIDSIFEKDIEELSEVEADMVLTKLKELIKENVELESYTDYPESASNNAKRALEYVDKNGWGSCGEATGKQRANQLSNKEPISRDTIARMASFKRHQQHKDVPYSEGCGGLMWDCWGGTSGIEWAINKLKEIDGTELEGAQPSVASSYPGEIASGSISPALIGKKK